MNIDKDKLISDIERIKNPKVLVVGDLALDEMIYGDAERISREAPVLILQHTRTKLILGGASNAAHNVATLNNGKVGVIGVVGNDYHSDLLYETFENANIDCSRIVKDKNRKTIVKTRISGSCNQSITQQIVRIDRQTKAPLSKETEDKVIEQLSKLGGTPYYLRNIKCEMDNNIFVNLKDLNQLRRDAIIEFENIKLNKKNNVMLKEPVISVSYALMTKHSILVRNEMQLGIALKNNIDFIYVTDYGLYLKYKSYSNVYYMLSRVNTNYQDFQNERLLACEYGSVIKYASNNDVRGDYALNVANDISINYLDKISCKSVCLSLELNINDLIKVKNKMNTEVLVYGRPLCMIIKNNIFNINKENSYLKNEKNQIFPVISDDFFTYVYNDKPIDLLNNLDRLKGFGTIRIDLFDEDAINTQKIIDKIKNRK